VTEWLEKELSDTTYTESEENRKPEYDEELGQWNRKMNKIADE